MILKPTRFRNDAGAFGRGCAPESNYPPPFAIPAWDCKYVPWYKLSKGNLCVTICVITLTKEAHHVHA